MTLSQLAQLDCTFLTPAQAAPALGSAPYWISLMARDEEGRKALGFPVVRIGTRTKIPRVPFLRYMGWEGPIVGSGVEAT